ncbi:hypothetical protein QUB05_04750 [Microcoleus sp. F10-C6]|uniref:hypothetical protein n=1 Tax=unclassified Microcoleus TaxID=2642155 RepID=UPI002FD564BB
MITTKPKKTVITVHIHSVIARLAKGAIERGEIVSCKKITANSYFIKHLRAGQHRPQTEKFTAVGAATLLYLLNVKAKGQNQIVEPEQLELDSDSVFDMSEPELEPESEPELSWEAELNSKLEPESETGSETFQKRQETGTSSCCASLWSDDISAFRETSES